MPIEHTDVNWSPHKIPSPTYRIPGSPGLTPPGSSWGRARDPLTGRFVSPIDVWGSDFAAKRQVDNLYVATLEEMREFGLDITTFLTSSDVPTLESWRLYIQMARQYISLHGGDIIGDAVKMEYFSRGQGKWSHIAPPTFERKKWLSVNNPHRYPSEFVPHPLARATYSNVRLAGGGWRKYLSFSGFKYNQYSSMVPRYTTVDAVAYMAPKARFLGSASNKTYGQIVRDVSRGTMVGTSIPRYYTAIQVNGVVEAFRYTPHTLYHEQGYYNVKASKRVEGRPFIARGIYEGLKRIAHLWDAYHKYGEEAFNAKYRQTMAPVINETERLIKIYSAIGKGAVDAAIRGKAGMKDLPEHYSMIGDESGTKIDEVTLSVRQLFGNHLIWWFLPPSKWWHYVGVLDDIRSLVKGGVWSLASIQAMIRQMTLGILGARMGSPIPFTRKARRRKFRKGIYTRAGYHRENI